LRLLVSHFFRSRNATIPDDAKSVSNGNASLILLEQAIEQGHISPVKSSRPAAAKKATPTSKRASARGKKPEPELEEEEDNESEEDDEEEGEEEEVEAVPVPEPIRSKKAAPKTPAKKISQPRKSTPILKQDEDEDEDEGEVAVAEVALPTPMPVMQTSTRTSTPILDPIPTVADLRASYQVSESDVKISHYSTTIFKVFVMSGVTLMAVAITHQKPVVGLSILCLAIILGISKQLIVLMLWCSVGFVFVSVVRERNSVSVSVRV
jgi:hypothetical protein